MGSPHLDWLWSCVFRKIHIRRTNDRRSQRFVKPPAHHVRKTHWRHQERGKAGLRTKSCEEYDDDKSKNDIIEDIVFDPTTTSSTSCGVVPATPPAASTKYLLATGADASAGANGASAAGDASNPKDIRHEDRTSSSSFDGAPSSLFLLSRQLSADDLSSMDNVTVETVALKKKCLSTTTPHTSSSTSSLPHTNALLLPFRQHKSLGDIDNRRMTGEPTPTPIIQQRRGAITTSSPNHIQRKQRNEARTKLLISTNKQIKNDVQDIFQGRDRFVAPSSSSPPTKWNKSIYLHSVLHLFLFIFTIFLCNVVNQKNTIV